MAGALDGLSAVEAAAAEADSDLYGIGTAVPLTAVADSLGVDFELQEIH